MLDKAKLLKALQQQSEKLFLDISHEYHSARVTWERIAQDPLLAHKIAPCINAFTLPSWQGGIADVQEIVPKTDQYWVLGVDGSQIYPDKHQGTSCALVNIGLVAIAYGGIAQPAVLFNSEPTVLVEPDQDQFAAHTVDSVNCHRQELELLASYEWCIKHRNATEHHELITLCDGSLIFWHLESKDQIIKTTYLTSYLATMQQMYEAGIVMAGYISMPKSKDLVNVLRAALCDFRPMKADTAPPLEHLVDAHIAQFFLQEYQRSVCFKSSQPITQAYPEHLSPYFFYLHVGTEIARIEIPQWVAHNQHLLDRVSRLVLDQALKGNGYPVVLAEAHEQAVVKGPDREFFYHLIQKMGVERKKRLYISPKSLKKRGIGI